MTAALPGRSVAPLPADEIRPAAAKPRRAGVLPYLLITPVTIFIVVLALLPAGVTIVQSFFTVNALDPPVRFSGLDNFRELFANPDVLSSAVNTSFYVLVGVVLSTVLGIAMAVALQAPFRGRSVVIAIMILPWALPGVVEGILWSGIFDPRAGLINGVSALFSSGATDTVLIGQSRLLTVALIELVQVWQITPLSALLILAAMQLIPGELYEAARIDGAGPWKSLLRVTLPLARAGIAVAMVQAMIATLNVFDQPYILNGAAATGSSVTMETYFISFQNLNFGAGYALSLLITVTTLVLSALIVRLVYRRVDL